MLPLGFFDGIFGFIFLDLFDEGVGDVDTEVVTHEEDPGQHVGELLAYLPLALFYIHFNLFFGLPLKMLQHFCRLERERYGAVLGIMKLLPIPLVTKRRNLLRQFLYISSHISNSQYTANRFKYKKARNRFLAFDFMVD